MKDETRNEARNRQRLEAKLRDWLEQYKAIFLTLTFSDKTLEETNEEQREALIMDYLRKESAFYIANRDYGTKNGREHYHAVAVANTLNDSIIEQLTNGQHLKNIKNRINLRPWLEYGQIEGQFIGNKYRTGNDRKANEWKETAHNLAEHFRKESARNSRLIFSRGEASQEEQIERLYRLDKGLEEAKQERLNKKRKRLGQDITKPMTEREEIELELEEIYNFDLDKIK